MDLHEVLDGLVTIIITLVGYLGMDTRKQVKEHAENLNNFKIEVAKDYTTKLDIKEVETRINARFDEVVKLLTIGDK